jgi:hypothetical protein
VVVSEQKIETAQDAGCDAKHCNQKRYSGHGLSSQRGCWLIPGAVHWGRVMTQNGGRQQKDRQGSGLW